MNTIHQILIESVSSGFWKFAGYCVMTTLLLGIPAKVIITLIQLPLRHSTLKSIGYPPEYCNADGELKEKTVKE